MANKARDVAGALPRPFARLIKRTSRELAGRVSALTLACLSAVMLSACGADYEWRQKVTIEARADGKTYRGSSVTQVVVHHRGFDMSGIPHPSDHYGEAPLVDMGEHGVIIVALRDLDEGLAISTFQPELGDALPERIRADDVFRESLRILQSARWKARVPEKYEPMLLHFPRPDEPDSVRVVSSESVLQGSSIEIVGVTIELTDEPVTTHGLAPISWAYELGDKRLDGSTKSVTSRPLANTIYRYDFVR